MKFISWNVNGLRAIVKNFSEVFEALDADFFCLQKQSCKKVRLNWIYQAIINTGIMRRRRLFRHGDFRKRTCAIRPLWIRNRRT